MESALSVSSVSIAPHEKSITDAVHNSRATRAHLVEEVLAIIWRKRRVLQAEGANIKQGLKKTGTDGKARHHEAIKAQARIEGLQVHGLEKLTRYETHLDRKFARTLSTLLKMKKLRNERIFNEWQSDAKPTAT
jgi:hypothetical protein